METITVLIMVITLSVVFSLFSEVKKELLQDIRAVALEGAQPSSYIRALLTIARTADNLACLNFDPVLKKHFSKQEYGKAKETIDGLVGLDRIHQRKQK